MCAFWLWRGCRTVRIVKRGKYRSMTSEAVEDRLRKQSLSLLNLSRTVSLLLTPPFHYPPEANSTLSLTHTKEPYNCLLAYITQNLSLTTDRAKNILRVNGWRQKRSSVYATIHRFMFAQKTTSGRLVLHTDARSRPRNDILE